MTNSINEILLNEVILLTGTNTTENHPVIGSKIKQAVKKGAKLIVVDPREIDLTKYATLWLRPKPGTDVAWLNGLMHVIIEEGLYNQEFVQTRTEGFEQLKTIVKRYTPDFVEGITDIPRGLLRKAARLYATANRSAIYYAMGITQHISGTDNVKSIANLSMLCGMIGREGTGVNPLRGQNNVQGACDMGALPDVFPGYQKVADVNNRQKFEKAWDVTLPDKPGLTLVEMINAAHEGKIKALYIMGENPVLSDPDSNHLREALEKLDFLVVQDIFMTETAELADVVLPSVSFAEKEGTFTNTERRVQRVRRAIKPIGQAWTDSDIICHIGSYMGYDMIYTSPSDIMDEIASLTPSYGGINYPRLESEGLQWPCPNEDHPGTKILHKNKFTRGLGLFQPVDFIAPAELPDEEYPLVLSTGRVLYHYHTGTMTGRVKGLKEIYPEGRVEINPVDAEKLGIADRAMVEVASRRGRVQALAEITEKSPQGTVFMTFHFKEAAANMLTNPALDPVGKIPEFKFCAVKVTPVST